MIGEQCSRLTVWEIDFGREANIVRGVREEYLALEVIDTCEKVGGTALNSWERCGTEAKMTMLTSWE